MGRKSEWTRGEEQVLLTLYKVYGNSISDCAKELGKSYECVRRKLKELEMRGLVEVGERGSGRRKLDYAVRGSKLLHKAMMELMLAGPEFAEFVVEIQKLGSKLSGRIGRELGKQLGSKRS